VRRTLGPTDPLKEYRVAATMGQDGEVVAHQTSGGIRTLHAYVDGATSAADTVATGIASSGDLTGTTKVTYDPAFDGVAHLRPLSRLSRPTVARGSGSGQWPSRSGRPGA
jgi:hypothetical protein